MGKPKKRTSHRRTGSRRSHLVVKLARAVNARSPVKVYTTRKESGSPEKSGSNKKTVK
jgi:ribosomal protein L32